MESLLPSNASQLDRQTEQVMAQIDDIPISLRDVWNPDTCPPDFLPFIAWALSVDHWNDQWSEAIKRRVIKASIAWHKIKGTEGAVRQALASLGATVEMTEWWQLDPPGPVHTFTLKVWANENLQAGEALLTDGMYADMRAAVDASKPVRSHYTMQVGARLDADIAGGSAITSLAVKRTAADADLETRNNSGLNVSPVSIALSITQKAADLSPMANVQMNVQSACASNNLSIVRSDMEAVL